MRCAWQYFLNLLPSKYRSRMDAQAAERLQELRIRVGAEPEMVYKMGSKWISEPAVPEDITYIVNAASRYSPWATASIRRGYITAPGGHRIGLCGDAIIQNGEMSGIRSASSLCMRVARDFPGLAKSLNKLKGSVLIIGAPGSGKTTLLRDLIRQRSNAGPGSVGVVDERGELFPCFDNIHSFDVGIRTDILTGCDKRTGIEVLLRTMGPSSIAVDEITAEEDCKAMMNAGWSGVSLLATAHAESIKDLHARILYRPIVNSRLFSTVVCLDRDQNWTVTEI